MPTPIITVLLLIICTVFKIIIAYYLFKPHELPMPMQHPAAMAACAAAVRVSDANLGIVFDTDVDRWGLNSIRFDFLAAVGVE